MDQTDAKILKILSENANTTATEIGDTVGLSGTGGFIRRF